MTTLTVYSAGLANLLCDVRPAAHKDMTLPTIAGVLLHTATDADDNTILVGSATNRFVLIQGTVDADATNGLPGAIWLTNGQVSQLLAMLRPYTTRRASEVARTDITVADGRVSFTQADQGVELGAISMTVKHDSGDFPDFLKLVTPALEAEPSAEPFQINGRHLADLAMIAQRRREYIRMRSTGKSRPVLIQIGRNLLALAMPIRFGENDHLDIPVYGVPVLDQAVAA